VPPRLVYVGDVPVESSYHGSALLYRLLQRYPAERLLIIEGNLSPARTDRRLRGVTHRTLHVGRPRLLNTRFHAWYARWLLLGARRRVSQVRALTAGWAPEAVLTVGHGYSWVTAAQLARDAGLPLHLIVHDDWPRVVAPSLRPAVDRAFAEVYRQAATRFCSSLFMVEDYERRYGAKGTLLLPYRAADAPTFAGVAERLHGDHTPVFAFAGTINSSGYAALLRDLADGLSRYHGELVIFGPITPAQGAAAGLDRPNIRFGGMLSSEQLLPRLRAEADALFVPMSFAPEDRQNMRMGFPSKLTDYTAVGLPMLIMGPPDCSAVRWAHHNPGVAEIVESDAAGSLEAAIARIATDADHRMRLARNAQDAGHRAFSATAAETVFLSALQSTPPH
jgi:glycosyltransferase involved in cell wall biosynthesis